MKYTKIKFELYNTNKYFVNFGGRLNSKEGGKKYSQKKKK